MDPLDFAKLQEMKERDLLILLVTQVHDIKTIGSAHLVRLDDHDKRIGRLELWRTGIAGGVAAISGVAYLAWEYVKAKKGP